MEPVDEYGRKYIVRSEGKLSEEDFQITGIRIPVSVLKEALWHSVIRP